MRKARMTETEYLQVKSEIEDIQSQISLLRDRKRKLTNRIRWYEYTAKDTRKDYTKTIAFQMFGKRLKDLTEDEKKEYNRARTRISRSSNKSNGRNVL